MAVTVARGGTTGDTAQGDSDVCSGTVADKLRLACNGSAGGRDADVTEWDW